MVMSGLWVVWLPVRVYWKSAGIRSGEQYAITPGTIMLPWLFVDNLNIHQVCAGAEISDS